MPWLKNTILPRAVAPRAESSATERASITSAVAFPPTLLPSAVSARGCPTTPGAGRISPLSSPRTQCGTLTGSRRTESPSCWNRFSAHCTAASAPGDPDSLGPMASVKSRRRAYATPSASAPPTSWRATSGETAADNRSSGSSKARPPREEDALYAKGRPGACAPSPTMARGVARRIHGLLLDGGRSIAMKRILLAFAFAFGCGGSSGGGALHNNAGSGSATLLVTADVNATNSSTSPTTSLTVTVKDGLAANVSGATVTLT